ncbi:unnamed protein product, partial [Effrenium voratum]
MFYIFSVVIFMIHACLGWKKVTPVLGIPRGHIAKVEMIGYAIMIVMGLVYISFPLYVMATSPFSGYEDSIQAEGWPHLRETEETGSSNEAPMPENFGEEAPDFDAGEAPTGEVEPESDQSAGKPQHRSQEFVFAKAPNVVGAMRFGRKLALQVTSDQTGAPYLSHKAMKEAINKTVRDLRLYQARWQSLETRQAAPPEEAWCEELGKLEQQIKDLDRELFAIVDEDLEKIHSHIRQMEASLEPSLCQLQDMSLRCGLLLE